MWRWIVLAGAVALLVALLVYGAQCGGGGQYRSIGEKMQTELQSGRIPGSYMYVADHETKLYWPNQPRYAEKIPANRRVYILDGESLAEFKGYKPGPL